MATLSVESIVDGIESDFASHALALPSLPEVVIQIRAALNDNDKDITDVARIIRMDPALAARIIQISNSPLYFSDKPIIDIRQAIMRLGFSTVRNLITCLAMHNVFTIKSEQMHKRIKDLWQHSCQVAAVAQVLGSITNKIDPDKALLAGLLHDIGVLPILVYADTLSGLDASLLDEVITQLRGNLGQSVLQQWRMSEDLFDVPLYAEDWLNDNSTETNYVDIIIIAQAHCYLGTGKAGELPPFHEIPALQKHSLTKMGPDASLELIQQAQADIKQTIRLLNA